MESDIHVTFKGLPPSPALEQKIRAKVEKLERFHHRITSCRVLVESLNGQERLGRIITVRVDVVVPGAELVATREAGHDHNHEDVHVALRDAFDAVLRQLEDHVRRQRGDVKHHGPE